MHDLKIILRHYPCFTRCCMMHSVTSRSIFTYRVLVLGAAAMIVC